MKKKKRYKLVALIPARSGSQRIKDKNILKLFKKPLIAHSIIAAKKSKLFSKIIVSTDSKKYAFISKKYGADVPFLRPKNISTSGSSDFEWVKFTINKLKNQIGLEFTHFFILRPTNPFRNYKTIIRAWKKFKKIEGADSLRAVEICKQHPGKMWKIKGNLIKPLIPKKINKQPLHNLQFKTLPKILTQNASLEISKVEVLHLYKTITGKKIIPFYTTNNEGFDINYPEDLVYANFLKQKKL